MLLYASILHDIGVHTEGPKRHHKTALNIILESPILQFKDKTRLIIGSIARYHRGSLPDLKHDHFKALGHEEREVVLTLSAILRVADGLDYYHRNRIRDIRASFSKKTIKLDCLVKRANVNDEISAAENKGDLLQKIFNRSLKIKMLVSEEFLDRN